MATFLAGLTHDACDLWDSGEVAGNPLDLVYQGRILEPTEAAFWRVRLRAGEEWGPWSEPSFWEAGLLSNPRWHAKWIAASDPGDWTQARPVTLLRHRFEIPPNPVSRARLSFSAHGLILPMLNGHAATDIRFAPGWTDYGKRIQYDVEDVGALLHPGANVLGAYLADGWACGQVCWFGRNHYHMFPAGLLRLSLEFQDREPMLITSGPEWTWAHSGIRHSDLMQGERFVAGIEDPDWLDPDFADEHWQRVRAMSLGQTPLVARVGPPVRVHERLEPVDVQLKDPSRMIVDFGQNHAGIVELAIPPGAGKLQVRHAEILTPEGELYTENLRSAKAADAFEGDASAVWSPSFTFHGYRYAEISGYAPGQVPHEIYSCVLHSDMERTGWFECSDARLNRLFENVVWSTKSNFLEVPTDCPQRDERLGWLGDAQVFAPTASYLFDVAAFMTKWMDDVRDGVSADGIFPNVAPQIHELVEGAPGWADAGVIVPWTMFRFFGDRGGLEAAFPSMERYVGTVLRENPDFIWRHRRSHDFGDWLNVDDETDKALLASAFLIKDLDILARTAAHLDDPSMEGWQSKAEAAREAFLAEFSDGGMLRSDTQTAYALAISFGIGHRERWGERLNELVSQRGGLSTGFLGVAHLLPALDRVGKLDAIHLLLQNDAYPSWLYSVKHGATTTWERWDGWTEEKGFQDPGMNSFNHYAFGSVGEYLMGGVAGIRVLEGPLNLMLKPNPFVGLTYAKARWDSRRGTIRSEWTYESGVFDWTFETPYGIDLSIELPATPPGTSWTLESPNAWESGEPWKTSGGRQRLTTRLT